MFLIVLGTIFTLIKGEEWVFVTLVSSNVNTNDIFMLYSVVNK